MHPFLSQWQCHRTPALQSAVMLAFGLIIAKTNSLTCIVSTFDLIAMAILLVLALLYHKWRVISLSLLFVLGILLYCCALGSYRSHQIRYKGIIYATAQFYAPPSYKKNKTYHQKVQLKPQNIIVQTKLDSPLLPGQSMLILGSLAIDTSLSMPWESQKIQRQYKGVLGSLEITSYESRHETAATKLYKETQQKLEIISPANRGLYQATLFGERYRLSPRISAALQEAGMSHFLAISGLHIGLFSGLFLALFFVLPLPKAVRGLLALGFTWMILLWTGPSASTIRALLMISFFLSAPVVQRRPISLNTLGATALLYLILYPLHLFTVGFQLSFAATFAIILSLPLLKRLAKWPRRIATPVVITLVAQGATLPFLILSFGTVSMVGFVFNTLFLPFFAILLQCTAILLCIPIATIQNGGLYLIDLATTHLVELLEKVLLISDMGLSSLSNFPIYLTLLLIPLFALLFWGPRRIVMRSIYLLLVLLTVQIGYIRYSHNRRRLTCVPVSPNSTVLVLQKGVQIQTYLFLYGEQFDPSASHRFFQWYQKESADTLACFTLNNNQLPYIHEMAFTYPSIQIRFSTLDEKAVNWYMTLDNKPLTVRFDRIRDEIVLTKIIVDKKSFDFSTKKTLLFNYDNASL